MLSAVRNLVPEIYNYCYLSYGWNSFLKFSSHSISSEEDAQQGDPLGPLLFYFTIHPMLQSLASDIVIGYLDDITLGGDEPVLAADVAQIQTQGEAVGLKLNINKCEFISDSGTPSTSLFQDFVHLPLGSATLLGGPTKSRKGHGRQFIKAI